MTETPKTNVMVSVPADLITEYREKYPTRQLSHHVTELLGTLLGKKQQEQLQAEEFVNLNEEVKEAVNDLYNTLREKRHYEGINLVTFYNEVLKENIAELDLLAKTELEVLGALIRYRKAVKDMQEVKE